MENRSTVQPLHPVNDINESLQLASRTYNDKVLPLGMVLDASYSTTATFCEGFTRWQMISKSAVDTVEKLKNEPLALHTRLTLVVFNTTYKVILENVIVADIDTVELKKTLDAIVPQGVTMLGKTFCATVELLERHREQMRIDNVARYMPIIAVFTDGLPTNADGHVSENTMSQAYNLADRLVSQNRLTVLPFGIASEGDDPKSFKYLMRLAGKQMTDGAEIPVVTNVTQLRKAFRYLGQTLITVASGKDLSDIHNHTCEVLGITMTQGV